MSKQNKKKKKEEEEEERKKGSKFPSLNSPQAGARLLSRMWQLVKTHCSHRV